MPSSPVKERLLRTPSPVRNDVDSPPKTPKSVKSTPNEAKRRKIGTPPRVFIETLWNKAVNFSAEGKQDVSDPINIETETAPKVEEAQVPKTVEEVVPKRVVKRHPLQDSVLREQIRCMLQDPALESLSWGKVTVIWHSTSNDVEKKNEQNFEMERPSEPVGMILESKDSEVSDEVVDESKDSDDDIYGLEELYGNLTQRQHPHFPSPTTPERAPEPKNTSAHKPVVVNFNFLQPVSPEDDKSVQNEAMTVTTTFDLGFSLTVAGCIPDSECMLKRVQGFNIEVPYHIQQKFYSTDAFKHRFGQALKSARDTNRHKDEILDFLSRPVSPVETLSKFSVWDFLNMIVAPSLGIPVTCLDLEFRTETNIGESKWFDCFFKRLFAFKSLTLSQVLV